jgi:hypothetical protein
MKMKHLITPLTLSLLILSIVYSSKALEYQTLSEGHLTIQVLKSTPNLSVTPIAFEDDSTTEIIDAYLQLKDALVNTNGKKASIKAKELEILLPNQKCNSLKKEVRKITETTDLKIQRKSFGILSDQMVALVKNTQLSFETLYIQQCPMANGAKGANWLSISQEIRNPYYGDKMLKCGSVVEKI